MLTKNYRFIFTLWIIIFPILNRYATVLPYVTLAELGMIIIITFGILVRRKVVIEKNLCVFCIYLIINIIIAFLRNIVNFDLIGSTLRLLFLYLVVALFSKDWFDVNYAIHVVQIVGGIVSVYALAQVFCSFLGIYLPTYIHFFKLMENADTDAVILERASLGMRYRPNSILNEPAQLCTYLLLVLAILLFSEYQMKCWKEMAVLISVTCLISLSSTGILMLGYLWAVFFLKEFGNRGIIKKNVFISFLLIFVVGTYFLIRFDLWSYFIYKTFASSGHLSGILQSSRFADLSYMLNNVKSLSAVLFGNGIVDLHVYLPGFARMFYDLGLIALIIVVYGLVNIYKQGNKLGRNLLLLYVILNIGTEVMFGNFLILYLPFIICSNEVSIREENIFAVEEQISMNKRGTK